MDLATARSTSAYRDLEFGMQRFAELNDSRRCDFFTLQVMYAPALDLLTVRTTAEQQRLLNTIAVAIAEHGCGAEWSVCLDHRNTLRSTAGRVWCDMPGCGREWPWDRLSAVCGLRNAYRLKAPLDPKPVLMCAAHTTDAELRIDNLTVEPCFPVDPS